MYILYSSCQLSTFGFCVYVVATWELDWAKRQVSSYVAHFALLECQTVSPIRISAQISCSQGIPDSGKQAFAELDSKSSWAGFFGPPPQ